MDRVETPHHKEPPVPFVPLEDKNEEEEDFWGPRPAPPGDKDIDRDWLLDFQPAPKVKPVDPMTLMKPFVFVLPSMPPPIYVDRDTPLPLKPQECPDSPAGSGAVLRVDRDRPLEHRSASETKDSQAPAVPLISDVAEGMHLPPSASMSVDLIKPLDFHQAKKVKNAQPIVQPAKPPVFEATPMNVNANTPLPRRPRECPESPAGAGAVLQVDRDTALDYLSSNETKDSPSPAVPLISSSHPPAVPPISDRAERAHAPPPEPMTVDRNRYPEFGSAKNTKDSQSSAVPPVQSTTSTYSVNDNQPPVISVPEPNPSTGSRRSASPGSGSAPSSALIDRSRRLTSRSAQSSGPQSPVASRSEPIQYSPSKPLLIDRNWRLVFRPAYIDRDRPLNSQTVSGIPSFSCTPPTPWINVTMYPPASTASSSFANAYPPAVLGLQPSYYPSQPAAPASGPQPNNYHAPYQPVRRAPGPQTNYYPSPPTQWTDPNAYRPTGPGPQPSYYPAPNVYQPATPASPASPGLQTNHYPSPPTQWAGPNVYPPSGPTPQISSPYQFPPSPWVAYPPTGPPPSARPHQPQPQAPPIPPSRSEVMPSPSASVPSTQ